MPVGCLDSLLTFDYRSFIAPGTAVYLNGSDAVVAEQTLSKCICETFRHPSMHLCTGAADTN